MNFTSIDICRAPQHDDEMSQLLTRDLSTPFKQRHHCCTAMTPETHRQILLTQP